ncbi:putative Calcofluor white hypersensitive protein [Seiridium cardinale]|uniref:Calcofluor white hypersensitive protein n=1 Tax=Seiridium cardinale TaxID=138064 RepID=A0ABR2XLG0_9PEZI
MSRSRAPLFLGLTAAGGVGYYLYSAGGSPKVAQKQAEACAVLSAQTSPTPPSNQIIMATPAAHMLTCDPLLADAHKLSAKVKGELPGRGKEAEKRTEQYGAEAGAKFDSAVSKSQAEIAKAKAEAEAYAKDVKANTLKKVDEFDRKVETEAAKAKSGISSWFGGSK